MHSKIKEIKFQPSTVENVDLALFEHVNDKLNLHVDTNKGWKKVPVIWVSAERAFQIKRPQGAPGQAGTIRDSAGALILPIMTVERTAIVKDPTKKGTAWANIPPVKLFDGDPKGGSITIARRIQQNKTANFANADSFKAGTKFGPRKQINFRTRASKEKIVYETLSTPMPVYLEINYNILLKTEYQEQMNQLITPFATRTGGINYFTLNRNGHFYEAFIQSDFVQNNNISTLEQEERRYETKIDIKVLAYIIGGDKNEERPKLVIRENAVQVRMPREKIITGDISEHLGGDFFGLAGLVLHEAREIVPKVVTQAGGAGGGGGASALTVSDEGVSLTTGASSLNFVGAGVAATTSGDNVTVTVTTVAASNVEIQEEGASLTTALESINFVGPGVTATTSGADVTVTVTTSSVTANNFNSTIFTNSAYREIPSGNVNGVNAVFTTSNTMLTGSILLFMNGMLMRDGADYDYRATDDDEVTFTEAPTSGSYILINYVKS